MTVAELIAKLQEMPQDARVVTEGPDQGWENLEGVFRQPIRRRRIGSRSIGPYESCDGAEQPDEIAVAVSWAMLDRFTAATASATPLA